MIEVMKEVDRMEKRRNNKEMEKTTDRERGGQKRDIYRERDD